MKLVDFGIAKMAHFLQILDTDRLFFAVYEVPTTLT